MKVVDLKKNLKTGEHDKVWKGKPVKLDIQPTDNGFILLYGIEHEVYPYGEDGPALSCSHSICAVKVSHNWFHKLLGITEEQRIETGMKKLKKRWQYMVTHTKKFEDIRESYGIKDDGDIQKGY